MVSKRACPNAPNCLHKSLSRHTAVQTTRSLQNQHRRRDATRVYTHKKEESHSIIFHSKPVLFAKHQSRCMVNTHTHTQTRSHAERGGRNAQHSTNSAQVLTRRAPMCSSAWFVSFGAIGATTAGWSGALRAARTRADSSAARERLTACPLSLCLPGCRQCRSRRAAGSLAGCWLAARPPRRHGGGGGVGGGVLAGRRLGVQDCTNEHAGLPTFILIEGYTSHISQ